MPTKKRRVGFIPRSDVLDLINKLSYENNLSYSKIINILVEEALYKRGLFNLKKENKKNKEIKEEKTIVDPNYYYNFKNALLNDEIQNFKVVKEEPFDNEIYAKFLIFLQFQERMKETGL